MDIIKNFLLGLAGLAALLLTITFLNYFTRHYNNKASSFIYKIDIINNFLSGRVDAVDISELFPDRELRDSIKYIVIHHTAGNSNLLEINQYHKEQKNWQNGFAYHIFINKGGKAYIVHNTSEIDGSTKKADFNKLSVSFALQGDFDNEKPAKAQYFTLIKMISLMIEKKPGLNIVEHCNIDQTNCPGVNFDSNLIQKYSHKTHFLDFILWRH